MLAYLICIILLVVLYDIICNYKIDKRNIDVFLFVAAILMTFFYGSRHFSVGTDTIAYFRIFDEDTSVPFDSLWTYMWNQKSPLYVLTEWLFSKFIPSAQAWLYFISAFFFYGLSRFIKKNSKTPFLSYLIFFCIFGLFQMTGLRQSVAMVFLMEAFSYAVNRKIFKFITFIIIAYLFHKSALIFLPVYFLVEKKIRVVDFFVVFFAVFCIYHSRTESFEYIKSFTSYYYYEATQLEEPINYSIMIYASTFFSFIVSIMQNKLAKKEILRIDKDIIVGNRNKLSNNINTNMMYIACLFMPMVAINGSVRRIVMYFALPIIFILPETIDFLFKQKKAFFVKICLSLFLVFLLLRGVSNSNYSYCLFFM